MPYEKLNFNLICIYNQNKNIQMEISEIKTIIVPNIKN